MKHIFAITFLFGISFQSIAMDGEGGKNILVCADKSGKTIYTNVECPKGAKLKKTIEPLIQPEATTQTKNGTGTQTETSQEKSGTSQNR